MGKKHRKKQKKEQPIPAADYIVYTDGGCAYNPGGPGGCAAVVVNQKTNVRKEYSEGYDSTTNNRMEILAVILAMEHIPEGQSVLLYSDSQYVIRTLNGEYRKNKNVDLWNRLDDSLEGKRICPRWVKGHSGIPDNERCDQLCLEAMSYKERKADHGYKKQKEDGRAFYEKVDRLPKGAMGIEIELPEPFSLESVSSCSVNKYCEKYHVHKECAKSILEFYMFDKGSFKDYLSIKTGGIDFWSKKSQEYITEALEEQGMDAATMKLLVDTIKKYVKEDKECISCLRWYMRGLPLRDCIRKTLVNMEVAQNCK